jgi:hypothetical protein
LSLPVIAYTLSTTKIEIRAKLFLLGIEGGKGGGGVGGNGGGGGREEK